MPAENQERFLEGLKVLFEQVGYVPRKLRMNNLSAAVVKARRRQQETVYTENFGHFMSHYGFEPQACNPRKGNAKCHVEYKIGYMRYNFFTPSPITQDLTHLREICRNKAGSSTLSLLKRRHYFKFNGGRNEIC